MAGVEVEVAVLGVAVQAAVAVSAGWRSCYADDTDASCTGPTKSLECRYSLSRDMRAHEKHVRVHERVQRGVLFTRVPNG